MALEGEVPENSYAIPFGEANVVRDGKDVSIVTYGLMVHRALEAAAMLAKEGIEAEVVDLRTLSPLDLDTVLETVENTGRLVVVDEASPRCNIATDIAAQVASQAFGALKAGIEMVCPPHTPVPFSPVLEDLYIPSAAQIADAARKTMKEGNTDGRDHARQGHHAHRDAQMGPVDEGRTINDWLVAEGDAIVVGMPILDVETDKIANAVEASDAGILRRKVAAVGDVLPVKALLGVLASPEVSDAEIDAYVAGYEMPSTDEADEAASAYQYADVDGIRVRYAKKGVGGAPVLFLHGFGGDLDNWLFNLDALAEGHAVYALDLPAHGQSTPRLPGTTLAALAAFVARFMDAAGLEAAHVVGHSMGGGSRHSSRSMRRGGCCRWR